MREDIVLMKDLTSLSLAIEAVLFAASEPMNVSQLRRVLRRSGCDLTSVCAEQDGEDVCGGDGADDGVHSDARPADEALALTGGAQAAGAEDLDERPQGQLVHEANPGGAHPDVAVGASVNEAQAPEALGADANFGAGDGSTTTSLAHEGPPVEAADEGTFALTTPRARRPKTLSLAIREAIKLIERRWRSLDGMAGFHFIEVADGYTFRTKAEWGLIVGALKEEKPARLSRPAMESLAIVAYRQPVTKPEVDALRGVDCGGTLRVLLDRKLVAVVGKKEEPGRPLLYGTTEAFLSLFNLANLAALPSLREFNELNQDSEDTLRAYDGLPSLAELSASQKQFRMDEAPSIDALDAAVERLKETEGATRTMLMEHGVTLASGDGDSAEGAGPPPPKSPAPKGPEATLH